MDEKWLYMLLDVVNKNGDVRRLVNEGYTFLEIAELTSLAVENNYFNFINDKISITELGVEKMNELGKSFKKINKVEWIDPDFKRRIVKINKNDIFLPSQNDLSF